MNEEITRELPDNGSFAERVFARFDAIDARLEKLEARSYDTKPIWERALKSIMETGLEVGEIKTQLGVIEGRVGVIEGKVGVIEGKVGVIEGKVGVIEGKVGVIEGKVGVIEDKVGVIEDKVGVIEDKVGVIEDKVGVVQGKVGVIEDKVQSIESEIGAMKLTFRNEMVDMRRELKHRIGARLDLMHKILLENREDIRDAEERIRDLESKRA